MQTNDKPEIKAGQLWYVFNSYHYIVEISKIGIIRLYWSAKHGGYWECGGVMPPHYVRSYAEPDATLCDKWPEGVPKPQIAELIDVLKADNAELKARLGVSAALPASVDEKIALLQGRMDALEDALNVALAYRPLLNPIYHSIPNPTHNDSQTTA